MRQLVRFLKLSIHQNLMPAILACMTGTAAVLFSTGLFGLSAYLIAFTALHPSFEAVALPVVGVRFFGIARAAFRYLERLVSHNTTFRILRDIRLSIYERLEPFLPALNKEARRGGIVARMVSDVENLQEAFLRIVFPYMVAILVLISGFFVLWTFNPILAYAFGVIFAVSIFAAPFTIMAAAKGAWIEAAAVKQKMYNTFIEFSYGLAEILANGREDSWETKLGNIMEKDMQAAERAAVHGAAANALSSLFPGLSLWTCLVISCWLVSKGMLPGELVAVSPLVSSALFEAALPLFTVGARMEKAAASAGRIIDLPGNVAEEGKEAACCQKDIESIQGKEISIENLSFGYSKEQAIINNFQFTLRRGEIKALTGASGAGKTTIANLLLGFVDGYTGSIRIDGIDIKSLGKEKLRSLFSVIDQKPFFFNTTIRDNMRIAKPYAGDEEIFNVLKKAHVHDFVRKLPEGLDTVVAELGASLSGGELKRLSIARALLKDAPFFIFDEPTAGLDTVNEKNILELIIELSKTKGVLLITHRKSMLHRMDQVIRLERI